MVTAFFKKRRQVGWEGIFFFYLFFFKLKSFNIILILALALVLPKSIQVNSL